VKQKPVVRRRRADEDIEEAIAFYFSEAGIDIATQFANRLEEALQRISRHPAIGSPRYGHSLQIPDLRHLQTKKFPYLIFYVEKDRHIELARVLHASMDIPLSLTDIE
jgi:toxin ParE1/3/4